MSEISKNEMVKISQDLLNRYAQASHDHNPIHLKEEEAKKVGLPSVIAHGMLVAGLINSRVHSFQKEQLEGNWEIGKINYRFKAMTFLGETVVCGGRYEEKEDGTLACTLFAENERGEVKTMARVRLQRV